MTIGEICRKAEEADLDANSEIIRIYMTSTQMGQDLGLSFKEASYQATQNTKRYVEKLISMHEQADYQIRKPLARIQLIKK